MDVFVHDQADRGTSMTNDVGWKDLLNSAHKIKPSIAVIKRKFKWSLAYSKQLTKPMRIRANNVVEKVENGAAREVVKSQFNEAAQKMKSDMEVARTKAASANSKLAARKTKSVRKGADPSLSR